jgi:hypothetical protein
MPKTRIRPEDAFQEALDGGSAASSSPDLGQLAKLAGALAPEARGGARPEFRASLRASLLAKATEVEAAGQEAFAAAVEAPVRAGAAAAARAGAGLSVLPADVRALVAVASALEPVSLATPSPAFRFQLRNRLLVEAARPSAPMARVRAGVEALNLRMRRSLRAIAATGMAATLLAGGGAAMAAAHNSLPGDTLYGLKRFHESTSLLPTSGATKGFRLLGFARTRLHEVRGLSDRGTNEQTVYVDTLDDMDSETVEGTTIVLNEVKARHAPVSALGKVNAFAAAQVRELTAVIDRLPAGAQPAARDSLTLVERVNTQITNVLQGCGACTTVTPGLAGGDPQGAGSGSSVCSCGQTPTGGGTGTGTDTPGDGNGGTQPGGDGGGGGGGNPSPSPSPSVDLPGLPGDLDQTAEQGIDDLLDTLGGGGVVPPLPTPAPTITGVPTTLPTTVPTIPGVPTSSSLPVPSLGLL